jgi:hypothetical protein
MATLIPKVGDTDMEDRIYAAGHHEAFSAAINKFRSSKKTRGQQDDLYDRLCNWGATAEEADEFINLLMEE